MHNRKYNLAWKQLDKGKIIVNVVIYARLVRTRRTNNLSTNS